MIDKQRISTLLHNRDISLSVFDIDRKSSELLDIIDKQSFDFSRYTRSVFTQQNKKRVIYFYPKCSCEDIVCQYLKYKLDSAFHIKYASRNRIINLLFNILPIVKDMNDFVIIRVDFKSFFDSVLTKHVFEKYIKESKLKRYDKELLEQYANEFKYCYAGLCLSNNMTELICRDFDNRIQARLSSFGVVFYERYVDDIMIITNKYISEQAFLSKAKNTITEVFGDSPVEFSTASGKYSYISRRLLNPNDVKCISYLGYEFSLRNKEITKNDKTESVIQFEYGISEKKRKKYTGIIERAFIQYKKDKNIELLRQRLKIYSSRVVVARTLSNNKTFDWLTKGVVANYNELKHHTDSLTSETRKFLKNLYFDLLKKHGISLPYFMRDFSTGNSIYSLFSNMKRNRSIVFLEDTGVSKVTLVKWIRKINPSYVGWGKNYYEIVRDYLETIKIE